MFYYVYYSYEQFGRGYIGFRKSKVIPIKDTSYFGSFKDKSFRPTEKIILAEFDTPTEALEAEISLHAFFEVAENPHFANRAKQTSTGFTTVGMELSEETKKKISEARKGSDYCRSFGMLGKRHSEETKKKMSETTKHQIYTEETKKKMSRSAKMRVRTKEENYKISQTLKNKPRVQCPFCDRMLKEHHLTRHITCIHEGN